MVNAEPEESFHGISHLLNCTDRPDWRAEIVVRVTKELDHIVAPAARWSPSYFFIFFEGRLEAPLIEVLVVYEFKAVVFLCNEDFVVAAGHRSLIFNVPEVHVSGALVVLLDEVAAHIVIVEVEDGCHRLNIVALENTFPVNELLLIHDTTKTAFVLG